MASISPIEITERGDASLYKAILDNLGEGVYFVDQERRITYWNRGAERITGFTGQQVVGKRCADRILMHVDEQGADLCKNDCPVSSTLVDGQTREAMVYLHHAGGHRLPVLVKVAPIQGAGGHIIGAVETFSDNSSMVAALQRLEQLRRKVMQDPLTGLGNRAYVEMAVGAAQDTFQRHRMPSGVLFIDIDSFKMVNDTYGHNTGDQALKMVANTIQHNLRSTDAVGRWGGDEFVATLDQIDAGELVSITHKLRAMVERSSLPDERGDVQVTVSIGGTLTHDGDTVQSLVGRADGLLYESKSAGRNRVSISC